MTDSTKWEVSITGNAKKQQKRLPAKIGYALRLLLNDLREYGPQAEKWQNYGRLTGKKDFTTVI